MKQRLPIRLALVALATGAAAIALAGRKLAEPPSEDQEPAQEKPVLVESETDTWFV